MQHLLMDHYVQHLEPFLVAACDIVKHLCRYTYLTMMPFVCLNGILVAIFLLKSLFFKPKFVENRHQTIAIDTGETSADLDSNQVESSGKSLRASESLSMGTLMGSRISELYRSESQYDFEYISPSNETIKLNEKIGSGFIGVIYKLAAETAQEQHSTQKQPPPVPKCAKLVDMKSLLQIIEELNFVPGTLSQKIRLTNLFRSNTLGSSFLIKYLSHYHQFLDFARKLVVPASRTPNRLLHPNVLYYEQIFIHDGSSLNPRNCHKKTFKSFDRVERQQLPALVLLIMEQAKMNLRSVIINEWQTILPFSATVLWGRQIGSALAYIHQMGFAHLNLKPENILLFEAFPGAPVDPEMPVHKRYILKISDCATAMLLPTASKVLAQSHETSLYEMSPPFSDKFSKNIDTERYDVHCYAMILLLMLVGYEHFGRSFMLPKFPTGLLSPARFRLMDAIVQANRRDVPEPFVDLFKAVFEPNESGQRVTVQHLLSMPVLKL